MRNKTREEKMKREAERKKQEEGQEGKAARRKDGGAR